MSTIKLSARRWEMEIRPERGGRITSLRLDGEELLDQGIGVDQPTAEGFVEGGAFGWDEMVPNLDPTATLPDHGEAWRLPWEVLRQSSTGVVMQCRGRVTTWELERRIDLADSVRITYLYRNYGDRPHTAFWCAHPLLAYSPDTEISLDVPRPLEGKSAKVGFAPGTINMVRIELVEISWDAQLAPDLAVWVCNGDLGGYRQLAVEPSWTLPEFPAGGTYSWWMRLEPL